MATQTYTQVPPNSTGNKMDGYLTGGGNVRQTIVIGDSTTDAAIIAIKTTDPAFADYGLPTRDSRNGTSDYHLVSAGSTNTNSVKGSAAALYNVHIFNNAAYPVYVKIFNKATAPVTGTDTPVVTLGVQAGTQRDAVFNGMTLSLGLGVAITKVMADNDNTAVLANDCVIDVEYK